MSLGMPWDTVTSDVVQMPALPRIRCRELSSSWSVHTHTQPHQPAVSAVRVPSVSGMLGAGGRQGRDAGKGQAPQQLGS